MAEVIQKLGFSEQSLYRWKKRLKGHPVTGCGEDRDSSVQASWSYIYDPDPVVVIDRGGFGVRIELEKPMEDNRRAGATRSQGVDLQRQQCQRQSHRAGLLEGKNLA